MPGIIKRIVQLGPVGSYKRIKNRTQKKFFALKFASKAKQQKANHTWQQIKKKENYQHNFNYFWESLCQNKTFNLLTNCRELGSLLSTEYLDEKTILKNADKAANNHFEIFGKQIYFEKEIDWQKDFKVDIKIPWELSRFNHIYFLGKAFQITQKDKYAIAFRKQIESWINQNSFLFGVNWINPMEVAIRSVNWICGFEFFKNCNATSKSFWQKFVCSFYDHMVYLENNWEESDRPNNHYIADLVGYFYLTIFFSKETFNAQDFKKIKLKQKKCIAKILQQFEIQIHSDGTSWEGSTNYHKLVTEMFLHFKILCEIQKIDLPKTFYSKFNKMVQFLSDCSNENGNLVQIGDNDSGKFVTGIRVNQNDRKQNLPAGSRPGLPQYRPKSLIWNFDKKIISHYPNFGLTIIKYKKWHITFRHARFNKKQPSGHFHHDQLSITLSYDGIPIIVDPGTYVYTANKNWRNYFRSASVHNGPHVEISQNFKDLFQLNRKEQIDTAIIKQNENKIEIENHNLEYQDLGIKISRKLIFDLQKEELKVEDEGTPLPRTSRSRLLHFRPNGLISIFLFSKLAHFGSDCGNWYREVLGDLEKVDGFYSPGYGEIESCSKLILKQRRFGKTVLIIKKAD